MRSHARTVGQNGRDPRRSPVTLGLKDQAEAERVFKALAEKGTVEMALQETFWIGRFGMLIDRFGIPGPLTASEPPRRRLARRFRIDSLSVVNRSTVTPGHSASGLTNTTPRNSVPSLAPQLQTAAAIKT
jgi:hypothetical protein